MTHPTNHAFRLTARLLPGLLALSLAGQVSAQTFATTTVQGTVYAANGAPASGTLLLSWPAFSTAAGQAIAAGRASVPVASDGSFTANLAPNLGSIPAGLYYTAVFHLSDGSTSTEYWVVPATAQASLSQVRAQLMPAVQAVQAVNKSYVDQAIQQAGQSLLNSVGGNLSVPLTAPSLTASVNKVLLVTAPPYNASCDTVLQSTSIAVSASGVTSGFPFIAADIGKQINFGPVFLGALAGGTPVHLSTTIQSVAAGNAKLAGVPGAAFSTNSWNYGHNDTVPVQAAFNDAAARLESVQFPAAACMVGTIAYRGQSFFGAGASLTTVLGLPGQDVFAGPDSAFTYPYAPFIHDLTIAVDTSVNAAASAAGGNNAFPHRITGTLAGTAPIAPPVNVGPVVWNPNFSGSCGASIAAGSNALALSCGNFNTPPLPSVVGLPITVNGAGAGGANLVTTIASYVSPSQVTLAAGASTTVTNAAGAWGNAMNPPWYIGNCGFAIPQSDQSVQIGNFNGAEFKNLVFTSINSPWSRANFTCGIFFQASPYDIHLEKVDFDNLWGGYIEALPALNFTQSWAWTPDTSTYKDVNAKFTFLPMVWFNGTHRTLDGLSIYSAGNAYSLGLMQFVTLPNGYSSSTITHYYHECWSGNSGELARFSSNGANGDNIVGGNLQQCGGPQYIEWNAGNSTVDAELVNLTINGNANTFKHLEVGSQPVTVIDNGFDNVVETNQLYYTAKRSFANRPKEPSNKLDAGFLQTGNSATPYTGGSDLLITCGEFNFAIQNGANPANGCTPDPTGAEVPQSYFHETVANYPTGWVLGSTTNGQGTGPYGKPMVVGDRIPQSKVWLVLQARCNAACSRGLYIYDTTQSPQVQVGYAVMNFGTSWTMQSALFNLSSVPFGDRISVVGNTLVGAGVTSSDVALIGFEPVNTDNITAAVTDPRVTSLIQAGSAGNPPVINAGNWAWSSQPGVPDPASPTGYSSTIQNGNVLTSVGSATAANGGLNGGALYPAVNSTVGFTVQGPPLWTDTLSAAQTGSATSLSIATATTAIWESGGCLLVDQEVECWSGTPALGSLSLTVARGQYGTIAQAHAAGATYSLVGTAQAYTKCNSVNYAVTYLVFGPRWSSQSSPFPAQNCSGYPTSISISFMVGPAGQSFKIAALTIAQQPLLAAPTGLNQVPLSGYLQGGTYGWTGTTATAFSAATPSIGGSALAVGCANQATVTVAGATTAMACLMSGAGGSQPPNIMPRCFVSAANTVTPQLCTAVATTPAAQTYTLRVIP